MLYSAKVLGNYKQKGNEMIINAKQNFIMLMDMRMAMPMRKVLRATKSQTLS